MKKFTLIMILSLWAASAHAATWYVDNSVASSGNGLSWTTAWKNISNITGVQAGDIVYISGGSTYSVSSWTPSGGTTGNPITYKIGQDVGHNGTATFDCGGGTWLYMTNSNVVVSGDAGDGNKHFQITNCNVRGINVTSSTVHNLRISYINFGTIYEMAYFVNNGVDSGVEIDHCYASTTSTSDHLAYFDVSGSSFGVNKVHDNTFVMPNNGNGFGADGFKGGAGTDFYNNTFTGVVGNYTGGQHQDGFQPLAGSYIRIYKNKFVDIANYPVFGDAYYGDFAHFWVYNNVVTITNSSLQSSAPPQGIAIGPDSGSYNNLGRWPSFTDVVVMNNTVVDYGGHACVNLHNNTGQSSVFTNCIVSNNICLNGGGFGIEAGITNSNNVQSSSGTHFVSYSPLSSSNNFHLLSTDTLFKDHGTSLSSYFTTDKDGVSRPQGSAWDIGAYEYNSGGTAAKPMPPTSLLIN